MMIQYALERQGKEWVVLSSEPMGQVIRALTICREALMGPWDSEILGGTADELVGC